MPGGTGIFVRFRLWNTFAFYSPMIVACSPPRKPRSASSSAARDAVKTFRRRSSPCRPNPSRPSARCAGNIGAICHRRSSSAVCRTPCSASRCAPRMEGQDDDPTLQGKTKLRLFVALPALQLRNTAQRTGAAGLPHHSVPCLCAIVRRDTRQKDSEHFMSCVFKGSAHYQP